MHRLLVTLVLATAVAGCGGDDALSVGEYRTELRKICDETERKSNAVQQPTRATPEAIVDYLTRLRDVELCDLVFVCRHDRPRNELVVVTLWEEGEDARVPRRFTDALEG